MADVIKVLGQSAPSGTTNTDLYTVPSNTVATISTLVVCNRTANPDTFRVAIRPFGAAISDEHYIYYDYACGGNEVITSTIGMTLGAGTVVTVYSSAADLSYTLFGVETS